ncbi:MAG: hypothetical protein CVU39_18285 [Chloroflexi bacterium HGW-Chloroflexi-10]|nr:MAG: hypothetical protein CVU39_18285 [Chloroflexi bacterium HGW-Chloroflexi-10]
MSRYPAELDLVLVAIIPSLKDMEIARLLGWYRVPIKSAPKLISADFIAFYQTGAFGESQRWQISQIARITGHELTTRASLFRDELDHPRASEEYYKIQLGPLQPLAQPILADRWRRVTFFYTTGGLLLRAKTLRDLIVSGEEKILLWNTLRERAETQGYSSSVELDTDWEVDWMAIFKDLDKIKKAKDG